MIHLINIPIKIFHTRRVRIVRIIPSTGHLRQIARDSLILHLEEMLPDQADLGIIMRRVERIVILQRVAIGMVDEDVAIGDIMHEQ